ncbi:hypothetical protein SCHPADRAFT_905440 [Schizopora paradoxa]|uniref:DUF7918 domain-containing protein n=1 Tax=Schizopora paradoxa TaxID=27342 RepID=A0A0H2RKD0_9AGAM|nr:hypothetical protein SCHPADRAFT_905440 [Schizopora paradoxa]
MPRHKGFNALVRVDKKALEEYVVETKDDSVTSWVVSEEGQIFDVEWRVEEHDAFYAAYLEVEGIPISGRTHCANERKHCWFGKRINDSEIRPFQFSRLNLTDDESQVLRASSNPTRSIIIRVFRIRKRETNRSSSKSGGHKRLQAPHVADPEDLDGNAEVFEKTKILNPHVISFSQQTRKMPRCTDKSHYKRVGNKDQPFFTFKIFYGPREFLRAQGIIPLEQERRHVSLSPPTGNASAKLRELELRMAEVDRQQAELQREMSRLRGPAGSGPIKREAKPVISFNDGEVIDLTGD